MPSLTNRNRDRCESTGRFLGVEVDVAAIKRLYEAGYSISEVATQLGLTYGIVMSNMIREGIPRRSKHEIRSMPPPVRRGPAHHGWTGEEASYGACHTRVFKAFGKASKCEVCGIFGPESKYNWANLTGHYTDLSDYAQMCKSCHTKYDHGVIDFRGFQKIKYRRYITVKLGDGNLVMPPLCGKILQKVVDDGQGNLFIHTKQYVVKLENVGRYSIVERDARPEPLVISAKK